MKLRNKKTGEIADLSEGFIRDAYNGEMIQIKPVAISNHEGYVYNSLAELNEEWEDYEEPKEFWYIGQDGVIFSDVDTITKDYADRLEAIGNYFETKEEAEKAVEKLKAWKRLKDKGFKITNYHCPFRELYFEVDEEKFFKASGEISEETERDLGLLFGGGDD